MSPPCLLCVLEQKHPGKDPATYCVLGYVVAQRLNGFSCCAEHIKIFDSVNIVVTLLTGAELK